MVHRRCSTGLGRHLAKAVLERGHNAIVTARDAATIRDLAETYTESALALSLDVTAHTQITDAMNQAEGRFGAVDVLVNNAGYGYRAAVEEGEEDAVAQLLRDQFFRPDRNDQGGSAKHAADAGAGRSSTSPRSARVFVRPGSGYYSASKAALEAMSGSLRGELGPLGITVTVVEPGGFRTEFAGRSLQQAREPIADYADTAGRRRKEHDTYHGTQPGDPARAAEAIITAVEAKDPPFLLLLGKDAWDAFQAVLEPQGKELGAWRELSLSTGLPN